MKACFSSILVLFIVSGTLAQIAPTTKEEYNLIVAKYKVLEEENRVDSKDDYEFRKFRKFQRKDRDLTLTEMFRKGEKSPCAVMLKYEKKGNEPDFICLPTKDAALELWNGFYEKTYPADGKTLDYKYSIIVYALAQYAMYVNSQTAAN